MYLGLKTILPHCGNLTKQQKFLMCKKPHFKKHQFGAHELS